MPRHSEWSPDETHTKKHKRHKHKSASDDEEPIPHKKSKHRTTSPDLSPSRPSKHKSHKKDFRKSPERSKLREIKKDRNTDDYDYSRRAEFQDHRRDFQVKREEHEFQGHHRRDSRRRREEDFPNRHRRDFQIKKEEDFDRRQQELRERRRDFNDERGRNDNNRRRERQRRDLEGTTEAAFQGQGSDDNEEKVEKEKPNLGLSGALTEDTNTFRGVVIKYNEPPEARKPKKRWRLYPFKRSETLKTLYLHRQSAFLLGRQRRIADIPIDHPSCSKQHAVLQFRMVEVKVDGVLRRRVQPYVIDLGSANGTYVNNERIDAQRYVQLKEQDVLKFGFSSREYVLLHDKSDTAEVDSESEIEEEG